MSRKIVFVVCLFAAAAVGSAAFAYETASFESISIDNFDSAEEKDFDWGVNCSRFVHEGSKQIARVEGAPNAIRNLRGDDAAEPMVLGVKAKFDRKGDNWIEIFPAEKEGDNAGKPKEIELKGHVSQMDVWVWGLGYKYSISVLLRDTAGAVREVPLGSLNYAGWRNLSCKIPANIPQDSVYRSAPHCLRFVGFRITTAVSAPVDDIAVYFDNLKYLTNSFVDLYDGYELKDVEFGENSEGGEGDAAVGENAGDEQ